MRRIAAALVLALIVASCAGDDTSADPASNPRDEQATATGQTPSETPPGTNSPTTLGDEGDLVCWAAPPAAGNDGISFTDATSATGLVDPLKGMRAHAAAWTDINGDLRPDLVVGTFATARPDVYLERGAAAASPDRLLLSGDGGYSLDASFPSTLGRTSGAAFADLDGDGDDDLVLSRNVREQDGAGAAVTDVLENVGDAFVIVAASGIDPTLGGRSIGVLDVDEDGLLDLLVLEDRLKGGDSRLYRNLGGLTFEDVTETMFTAGVDGLGIATGDLNNDRHTDVFVAGSNRLFVGDGSVLKEIPGATPEWEVFGNEDDVAGAAIADVNRDGRLDLIVGHHYNSTLSRGVEVPVRLYLNRTPADGAPVQLEDVTAAAGLVGLPTKAPHVEIADLDNDGWPDIVTSASATEGTTPAVYRHLGLDGDIPTFAAPEGLGSAQYWVTAPTSDVDRDGRLDVLGVEWEPSLPSILFVNDAASGHWLEVSIGPELGGGVGTRIDVYEAGGTGDPKRLLGSREIVATVGYTAGVERTAHFGLGDATAVDIVVTPPLPHEPMAFLATVDAHIRLPDGCS